jgi:hypothetical protein
MAAIGWQTAACSFDPAVCPCRIVFLEIAPRDRDMNAAHMCGEGQTKY